MANSNPLNPNTSNIGLSFINNPLQPDAVLERDPLTLDMDDHQLVTTINQNNRDFTTYYRRKNLFNRQDKLFRYAKGDQDKADIPSYSLPYKENVIHEGIARIKPIAMSRLPDLLVNPGNDTPESKQSADDLTDLVNNNLRKRENRKLLGLAHKQEPIFFYAPVKVRWNKEKNDYEFINIFPKRFSFDHTCTTNNVDDMLWTNEKNKMTVKQMIMRFPDKKEKIFEELGFDDKDKKSQKKMATKFDVEEVWFHWYEEGDGGKWKRVDGVVWKLKTLILKKMKNPYFDWEGVEEYFVMKEGEKEQPSEDELYEMLFDDSDVQSETYYNNYFKRPRKPYFLMVYETWGEHPISVTSRYEQVLEFQDYINDEGRQIGDMNRRSVGKDIFNTDAIEKKDVQRLDPRNPKQAIAVSGNIRDVYTHVSAPAAPSQLYASQRDNREKAFEMMGVGATNRGQREKDSTMGQDQMARESDFGLIDDIVEDTINACAEWQAQWAMQMIKLFYDKSNYKRILGKNGDILHLKISRDLVEDGMEVMISASGVDKRERAFTASRNMSLGVGDPLSYYEDSGQSNPKERALRAMMAQGSPMQYIAKYLLSKEEQMAQTQGIANQLPPTTPEQGGEQQPPMGGGAPSEWRWHARPDVV